MSFTTTKNKRVLIKFQKKCIFMEEKFRKKVNKSTFISPQIPILIQKANGKILGEISNLQFEL